MIEAFEIGVSLALADGVADGIASAQRDADSVGRAVAAGTVSLERLRETGLAALTVLQPVVPLPRSFGPSGIPAAGADKGVDGAAGRPSEDSASLLEKGCANPAHPSATAMSLTGGRLPASDADPDRVVERRSAEAGPVALAGAVGQFAPMHMATSPASSGVLPQMTFAGAPMAGGFGDDAHGAPVDRPQMTPARESPYAGRSVSLRLDDYGRRGGSFSAGEGHMSVIQDNPVGQDSAQSLAVSAGGTAYHAPVFAEAGETAAATPSEQAAVQTSRTADMDTSAGGASYSSGPAGGDVFLDGALVGRWMSRLLSREAGRASAGPTGFDSRRNALLPGPTVGG